MKAQSIVIQQMLVHLHVRPMVQSFPTANVLHYSHYLHSQIAPWWSVLWACHFVEVVVRTEFDYYPSVLLIVDVVKTVLPFDLASGGRGLLDVQGQ